MEDPHPTRQSPGPKQLICVLFGLPDCSEQTLVLSKDLELAPVLWVVKLFLRVSCVGEEKRGDLLQIVPDLFVQTVFLLGLFWGARTEFWRADCGTGDSQRDSRESIRANHSQLKPLFL